MTVALALRDLNNAVLDLQSADYNTFERPLQRMSMALNRPELEEVVSELKMTAEFDAFLERADRDGSMMGSARLNWPADSAEELGLVIHLIERGAKDPNWFLNLAHTFYYCGRKIFGDIRKITTAIIIPFNRDFAAHVEEHSAFFTIARESPQPVLEQDEEELLAALFRLSHANGKRPSITDAGLKLLPEWEKDRLTNAAKALLQAGDILNPTGAMISVDLSSGARKRSEQSEENIQSGVTYNIGSMTNSPLQHVQSGGKGIQTTSYSCDDLHSIVALYRNHIDDLKLNDKDRQRADAQIATIEAQLMDEPDPTIIKSAGRSLKTIIESAIGGAVGNALASAPVWAHLLAGF